MTRDEAHRWYTSPCPGGAGHEYDAGDPATRWQKGDCYACVVDALTSPAPYRKKVETAVLSVIACARAVGFALGSGTHADVDERRESAARAALLSLIFPGDDR